MVVGGWGNRRRVNQRTAWTNRTGPVVVPSMDPVSIFPPFDHDTRQACRSAASSFSARNWITPSIVIQEDESAA